MGDDHHAELVRRVRSELPESPQHLGRLVQRPVDRSAEDDRPDRVQVVLERRGDAEVAAAATQPPEQLRISLGVDAPARTVGGDEVDGPEVVDGEPVLAHEVPETAAERQPADPDVTDGSSRGGKAEALCGEVELRPHQAPAARATRVSGSTETAFICERSIIRPSSHTE